MLMGHAIQEGRHQLQISIGKEKLNAQDSIFILFGDSKEREQYVKMGESGNLHVSESFLKVYSLIINFRLACKYLQLAVMSFTTTFSN